MRKRIALLFITLFALAGCSSKTEIISSSLETTTSAINRSNEAYLELENKKQVIELPIKLNTDLEKTTDNIDIKSPKKIVYSIQNGSVYVVGIYEENNNYYLVSYAYSLSSTPEKVVVPKNTTNVSIYKANDEIIKQIDSISFKD